MAGCSLLPDQKDETGNWSVERIYNTGREAMQEGNYLRAIKMFETLEARYPYGPYAQGALLQNAYSNYKLGEMSTAVAGYANSSSAQKIAAATKIHHVLVLPDEAAR